MNAQFPHSTTMGPEEKSMDSAAGNSAHRLINAYAILFALSVALINPFEMLIRRLISGVRIDFVADKTYIWTVPKFALVCIIALVNLLVILRASRQGKLSHPAKDWYCAAILWVAFLGWYGISILANPFRGASFFGLSHVSFGYLSYLVFAVFTLTNGIVLTVYPQVLKGQIAGTLTGIGICAVSIFPQVVNWRIDYTVTSGIEHASLILPTAIHLIQTPIGLFSHRGHAAFVLAFGCVLSVILLVRARRVLPLALLNLILSSALFFAKTRGPALAGFAGMVVLAWIVRRRPVQRKKVLVYGLGIFMCGYGVQQIAEHLPGLVFRKLPDSHSMYSFTSSRNHWWKIGARAIIKRPILGWAGEGFGRAFPYVGDWNKIDREYIKDGLIPANVIEYGKFHIFKYTDKEGTPGTGTLPTYNAHNIFINMALTTGIPGMLLYFAIVAWCMVQLYKRKRPEFVALGVVYLAYGMTWFDSSQFTHLAWWALSIGLYRGANRASI